MANEAHLADAGNWAERKYILLDLSSEPLTHLHQVTLSLVLVRLRQEDDSIWMLQRNLILKQSHVVVITLEAVH